MPKPKRWKERSEPLWERQKYESRQAFEAFHTYLTLGESRSLAKTAQALGKSKPLMDRWSSAWGWVERVTAYDDDQSRRRLKEIEDERRSNRRERINIQRAFLGISARGLKGANPEGVKGVRTIEVQHPDGRVERRTEEYWLQEPWSPHAIMRAAHMATRELRVDYDDAPDRRDLEEGADSDGRDLVRALKAMREDLDLLARYDDELDDE